MTLIGRDEGAHLEEGVVVDLLRQEDDARGVDGVGRRALERARLLPAAVGHHRHGVALEADAQAVPPRGTR